MKGAGERVEKESGEGEGDSADENVYVVEGADEDSDEEEGGC